MKIDADAAYRGRKIENNQLTSGYTQFSLQLVLIFFEMITKIKKVCSKDFLKN